MSNKCTQEDFDYVLSQIKAGIDKWSVKKKDGTFWISKEEREDGRKQEFLTWLKNYPIEDLNNGK